MSWHFRLDSSSGHEGPSSSPAAFPDSSQLSQAVDKPPLTTHGMGPAAINCISTQENSPYPLAFRADADGHSEQPVLCPPLVPGLVARLETFSCWGNPPHEQHLLCCLDEKWLGEK